MNRNIHVQTLAYTHANTCIQMHISSYLHTYIYTDVLPQTHSCRPSSQVSSMLSCSEHYVLLSRSVIHHLGRLQISLLLHLHCMALLRLALRFTMKLPHVFPLSPLFSPVPPSLSLVTACRAGLHYLCHLCMCVETQLSLCLPICVKLCVCV